MRDGVRSSALGSIGRDQGRYRVVRGGIEPPTSRFSVGSGAFVRMRGSAYLLVRCLQSCTWNRVGANSRQSDGCQGLHVLQKLVELLIADLSLTQMPLSVPRFSSWCRGTGTEGHPDLRITT